MEHERIALSAVHWPQRDLLASCRLSQGLIFSLWRSAPNVYFIYSFSPVGTIGVGYRGQMGFSAECYQLPDSHMGGFYLEQWDTSVPLAVCIADTDIWAT